MGDTKANLIDSKDVNAGEGKDPLEIHHAVCEDFFDGLNSLDFSTSPEDLTDIERDRFVFFRIKESPLNFEIPCPTSMV